MGLIEELIILVKEAVEEAQERNRPRPTATSVPQQRSAEEIEALRRSLARRAAEAREAEAAAEQERLAAHQRAEHERQQEHERQRRHHAAQQATAHAATAKDFHRVARQLRNPQTLRQMVVLREILDKPLALRRR